MIFLVFIALNSNLNAKEILNQDSGKEEGNPLPFLEQWNSGTFETNNWLTDGANWSINWQEGEPQPSAQFTWDPIQTDYSISLESYPLLADSITVGDIYLDFDLKLDNFQPTGTEQMLVQVWNWDSQAWTTVSTYSNEYGSFDWMAEHLNISGQALGKVFKIRFAATGESSLNIVGWYMDNINVYRECKAPYYLEATPVNNQNEYGILLEWEMPYGPDEHLLEWDDGVNSGNSIGTGTEAEFDCAARWKPSQLYDYEGYDVMQVSFFPCEAQAEYNIRIWSGLEAESILIDQPVPDPVIGQWNDITLLSPVPIDIYQDIWVGYHVNTENGYPSGVDDGPAIDGYGNMMNFGGWQSLLEINPELDNNWNIKVNIQRNIATDTVTKYAIYRSDNGEPYYFRGYSEVEEFLDDSAIILPNWLFCYQVTALYSTDLDWCESGHSNEACEWYPIGIKEQQIPYPVNIYPNPASDVLFIEAEEEIESVSIFDSRGETVKRWNGGTVEQWNGEKVEIPLIGLVPGLYLVRVETGSGVVGRKVVII